MVLNPIIEKELKTKMRGWKAPALLTGYLVFLGLVVFIYFKLNNSISYRYGMGYFNPRVALDTYNVLAVFQFILILLITPALTGGSISGERERQTLDLLLCTNISPFSIITGKVVVSIAHVLLLVTASLPILSIVFLFGGISILDMILLFCFYLVTALMVACIGIFYSTVFRKSVVSIIMTYITLGVLTIGTLVALAVWWELIRGGGGSPGYVEGILFMFANPLFGLGSVIGEQFFWSFSTTTSRLAAYVKPWMVNVLFDLGAAAGLLVLSGMRLRMKKS